MKTLLHIDSSPLETSVSRQLTREFITTWKQRHPAATVRYRDLSARPPSPLGMAWIGGAFTPEAARSDEQSRALAESDVLIEELFSADEIVIGVAMHNFSVPSVLKLWIDQVVRIGRTVAYGADGPQGLVTEKKVTILVATGGNYAAGTPAGAMNFLEPYLRAILGFIGLTDVTVITAGGTAQLAKGIDRAAFLAPTLEQIRNVAA